MPSHHHPTHNQRPTGPGHAGGKQPSGGQKSAGGHKPGQRPEAQPAPQATTPTQATQHTSQGTTTERGLPREEQAFMQKSASSTLTPHDQRHTIRSIHYTLSYTLQGAEHGTNGAVVLLHGLPGSAFSWRNVAPTLGAKRATYAFDMLSYGASDHPWPADVSIWGQADTLAPILRQLGLSNIVLVGYDIGGGVAQVLATRLLIEEVRAIVLISTTCYAQAFAANWPLPEMLNCQEPDAPRHVSVEQLINDLRATFPKGAINPNALSAEVLDQYINPWASELGKENLFQHIRQQLPNYSMSVASDMRWVNKPVLIIWGEKDEILPPSFAERLHRDIPGSRLALLPNTGHLVLEEAPQEVARVMNNFIADL